MKIPGKRLISGLAVSMLILSTTTLTAQSSYADNLPADTTYSAAITKLYSGGFTSAINENIKLSGNPAGTTSRTSAKYKAWVKQMNTSYEKMVKSISPVLALVPGPSYADSDPLLESYLKTYQSWISTAKKNLSLAKVTKAQSAALQKITDSLSTLGEAWNAQYAIDLAKANLRAPASTPTIAFSGGPDVNNKNVLTLYATTSNNSTFDQLALGVTSYVAEWYVGSITSTAIPTSVQITEPSQPASFSLSDVVSGGTYFFRIAAVNAAGQGIWSPMNQALMP
jgi:hypothetical protein